MAVTHEVYRAEEEGTYRAACRLCTYATKRGTRETVESRIRAHVIEVHTETPKEAR